MPRSRQCLLFTTINRKGDNRMTHELNWTSIKDSLPPVGEPLIVTIYNSIKNRRELKYPVFYRRSCYYNGYDFYEYGLKDNVPFVLLPEYSEVRAWMELPRPYQE